MKRTDAGDTPAEMRELGFEAIQLFYGSNRQDDDADPSDDAVRRRCSPARWRWRP